MLASWIVKFGSSFIIFCLVLIVVAVSMSIMGKGNIEIALLISLYVTIFISWFLYRRINAAKGIKTNNCLNCGKEFNLLKKNFGVEPVCSDCLQKVLDESIKQLEKLKFEPQKTLKIIKQMGQASRMKVFNAAYGIYEADGELSEKEIEILKDIQDELELSDELVRYEERIRPYEYVLNIRKNGELPPLEVSITGTNFVLKKSEKIHYLHAVTMKELKTVTVGYKRGSRGVSIRIVKGVSFRVGASRGHLVKEDQLLPTSSGILIVSNKRLFLQPAPGNKPVTIPINKIASYSTYSDGIELYKEGREKAYFFIFDTTGPSEIFSICLDHLMGQV
jgi:uncharacterized tellurite resistance protein B-like protein